MKLIFIRHGDPDYVHDSLTEKGKREAELLSEKMKNVKADKIYVSPLGRAKQTAEYSLKKMGQEAEILDWIQEFRPRALRPDKKGERSVSWDWLPEDWTVREEFFHADTWTDNEILREAGVAEEVEYIYDCFEKLLNKHGYRKEGRMFKAIRANNDTVVFFCHFAITSVLLGYLLNISPMLLWHGTCAAPTSVTTVVTEERREGSVYFRMSSYGDTSHLYAFNEPPAFAARFCECYMNENERHD